MVELEQVRKQGYGTSNEEYSRGKRSIAVPIVDSSRAVRAALVGVGLPNSPVWADLPVLAATVKAAAREVSRSLDRVPMGAPVPGGGFRMASHTMVSQGGRYGRA